MQVRQFVDYLFLTGTILSVVTINVMDVRQQNNGRRHFLSDAGMTSDEAMTLSSYRVSVAGRWRDR